MNREIKGLTLNFHYMYEKLAPEFGYETREDTKKFDFNSPNGKLMYKTVKSVMEPILNDYKHVQEKYNEALKQLIRYNIPCEIDGFNEKDENIDYCSENCGVDDNIYFKCWDRFIEQELDKGE